MTAALAPIPYGDDSIIVEADASAELRVGSKQPHERYVQTTDAAGVIRLIPLESLHESERVVLEDRALYEQTRQGLADAQSGRTVSSDWLFADDE